MSNFNALRRQTAAFVHSAQTVAMQPHGAADAVKKSINAQCHKYGAWGFQATDVLVSGSIGVLCKLVFGAPQNMACPVVYQRHPVQSAGRPTAAVPQEHRQAHAATSATAGAQTRHAAGLQRAWSVVCQRGGVAGLVLDVFQMAVTGGGALVGCVVGSAVYGSQHVLGGDTTHTIATYTQRGATCAAVLATLTRSAYDVPLDILRALSFSGLGYMAAMGAGMGYMVGIVPGLCSGLKTAAEHAVQPFSLAMVLEEASQAAALGCIAGAVLGFAVAGAAVLVGVWSNPGTLAGLLLGSASIGVAVGAACGTLFAASDFMARLSTLPEAPMPNAA